MVLAKLFKHEPWSRDSLAFKQASLQARQHATANEHESRAARFGLLDEVEFTFSNRVCHLVGSHQSDVQLRACFEIVLSKLASA